MLKRILIIGSGVVLGTLLSFGTAQLGSMWGWWPNRELDRNAAAVREVMRLVNQHYVDAGEVTPGQLGEAAARGIADQLDDYSGFMTTRQYDSLQEEMDSEFGGIGVQVEMQGGRIVVIAPIAGTPGEKAGIMRGDEIVSVDGEEFERPNLEQAVSLLRGRPRTQVEVGLHRPSEDRRFTLTLTRETIRVESVKDERVLEGGIGYLQLTHFAERTGREFTEALERLKREGMQALVLDLRNNPGGLLHVAAEVVEPFFERGELIVYTEGRDGRDRRELRARSRRGRLEMPVAVLLNGGSASASEIVAGALKDTGRAVVVGERSFGKGSVQTIFRLRDGAGLRLTTARYYTPSGVTIHEQGVPPDIEIVMTPEQEKAVRLARLRPDITDPVEFKERFEVELAEDTQLAAALEALRARL